MTIGGVPDMPVVVKDGMKDRRVVMIDYSTCIVRL